MFIRAYVLISYHNLVIPVWFELMDVDNLPPNLLVHCAIQVI